MPDFEIINGRAIIPKGTTEIEEYTFAELAELITNF